MAKITKLTAEQERELPIARERYRAIGVRTGHDLSCQVNGNAAILAARAEIGSPPPKAILWARSTAEALKWAYQLKRLADPKLPEPTGASLRDCWFQWSWGQTEQYWLGWYRFAIDAVGVKVTPEEERRLRIRERLAESCYGVITLNAIEIVVQHPVVAAFDDAPIPRLHKVDGPALRFADGYCVYAIHGIRLTPEVGAKMAAKTITATEIRDIANAEVRRVLVAQYSAGDSGRYLRDIGATVIHEDNDPLGLPRRLLRIEQPGDEPFVAVEVTNSTPEPDGTRKLYTFRCHPEIRPLQVPGIRDELGDPQEPTCLNAIASTYGYYGHEYQLAVQT
jgi:uncharacterized protein DUF6745